METHNDSDSRFYSVKQDELKTGKKIFFTNTVSYLDI